VYKLKLTEIDVGYDVFVFAAMHTLANRFQTLGDRIDPAMTLKQWFVLAAVNRFIDRPPNIGDIATLLGTSRQNIKKMAVILESRGFLKLEKDENDKRNILMLLTEQCNNYFKGREQQENEYIERIFRGISEDMLKNLCIGMTKLMENTDRLLED